MSKSSLEARFELAWQAYGDIQFGPPRREVSFALDIGRRWRFDFAWPAYMVAVEIDGGQWKPGGGRHNRDSDREKVNAAQERGWCVLRYSGAMLNSPEAVIGQVVRALRGRVPK